MNVAAFLLSLDWRMRLPEPRPEILIAFGVVPARLTVVLFNHGYVPWDLISGLGTRYRSYRCGDRASISRPCFCTAAWMHMIFNMWALWIFGDNVEDYLGHTLYLVLYLVCGLAAALLHTLFNHWFDGTQRGRQRSDCRSDGRVLCAVSAGACADPGAVFLRLLHVAAGVDRARLLVYRAVPERSGDVDLARE